PALRPTRPRRVRLRGRATHGAIDDRGRGGAGFRRGLDLRQPVRYRQRALFPRRRLPPLADRPSRHVGRRGAGDPMTFDGYAARRIDTVARDRARFGAGIVAELPSIVSDVGGGAAFVVTDPGVVRSGVAGRGVDLLGPAGGDA